MSATFTLTRDAFGRLDYRGADGEVQEGVVPVRAFPITAPGEGLSLVSADGHELVWLDSLEQVEGTNRTLIEEELARREFMPEIRAIRSVSGFVTPCSWEVETDRGVTTFTLKGEEDLRRIAVPALLVADSHGITYLIRDPKSLDRYSRKVLDRFL